MELKMNNTRNEIDELFDEIKKTDIYINYISCKKQLQGNEEIINIINEIKENQIKITRKYNNKLDIEIKKLYNKLYSYPIYQSYLEYKEDMNNLLESIAKEFNYYFKEILDLNL